MRLTPTESDNTPPPQVSVQPQSSDGRVTSSEPTIPSDGAAGEPGATDPPPAGTPGDHGASDTRIALREARRQRRRTAWLCAAVVAVCLALTIVVVSLARNRPPPSSGVLTAYAPVSFTPASASMLATNPHPGAPAPEGGNR